MLKPLITKCKIFLKEFCCLSLNNLMLATAQHQISDEWSNDLIFYGISTFSI